MELHAPTCIVRSYQPADAASLASNANNYKVWRNLRDRFPHPFTEKDGLAYITDVAGRPVTTSFAIVVDGNAVGGVSLRVGHDIERLSAELGYWLGESYWGRGVTTDAIRAVTRYACTELGLVRVFALPFVHNAASCRVLEKAGYQREATLRCSAIKEGTILDQYLYAAIASGHVAPATSRGASAGGAL